MKIGILTFHCAHNYGAVLQAYALQSYLLGKNYDVHIVDYRPNYLTSQYDIASWRYRLSKNPVQSVKNIYSKVKHRAEQRARYERFVDFSREFRLSPISQLANFDAYVIGSDQVWSTIICKGFDNLYWGNFPHKINAKIISYAASIGRSQWNRSELLQATELLNNFHHISVREESAVGVIGSLTNKPVYQVLDPTLLVGKDAFAKVATTPAPIKGKAYILTYEVSHMPQLHNFARRLAQKTGLQVYNLEAFPTYKPLEHPLRTAGPGDFIGMIKNAAFVITNSFHGTCFSILFNKRFYTLGFGNNTDLRSRSVLTALNLGEKLIRGDENITDYAEPDWESVGNRLQTLRAASVLYLDNALDS